MIFFTKTTYVKPPELNKKDNLVDNKEESRYSDTRTVTYDLTKPYGQPSSETAVIYRNRAADYGAALKVIEVIIDVLKIIK